MFKKFAAFALAFTLCLGSSDAFAQKGGGGGRSSFSGGSSGGGRSSFSGGSSGNSGRSSFSGGSPSVTKSAPPASSPPKSSFSGGSSSSPPANNGKSSFSGGSSGGGSSSQPKSSFSGGSSPGKVTTTAPVAGKTPTSTSTKPAASSFDSLAGKDAKKVESRQAYEKAATPAASYKTPAGKEVKIDPKDKQADYLRGRLDESRWQNRNSRESSFYGGYASRPVIIYNDCYHPMWNYWLLSQSVDTMALWCYHHQASMDAARLNSMYAENAGLRAKVAALEAQRIARDPTYMPANVDPDLAYNDAYVNACFNPHPKTVTVYEYDDDGPRHGGAGVGTVLLWVFIYIPLMCLGVFLLYYFVFVHRW